MLDSLWVSCLHGHLLNYSLTFLILRPFSFQETPRCSRRSGGACAPHERPRSRQLSTFAKGSSWKGRTFALRVRRTRIEAPQPLACASSPLPCIEWRCDLCYACLRAAPRSSGRLQDVLEAP